MDFYAINALRENHAGWSLLRAQNAPLAVSFFIKAFTGPNQRDIGRQELIDHLDDVLFGLREVFGEDKYPRPAGEYLDEWAAPERAWLRKYYVPGQDEPRYDLTAAAEAVVRWVASLRCRHFESTQSRLPTLFAVPQARVPHHDPPGVQRARTAAAPDHARTRPGTKARGSSTTTAWLPCTSVITEPGIAAARARWR